MTARLVRFADLAVSPWRNGAGRKADIASGPGWMVGFAYLDRDAPFSHYPGGERTITLVEGPGFALDFPGRSITVDKLFAPQPFDGGLPTLCRIAGPCVVLNAITDRGAWSHDVGIAPPSPTQEADYVVVLRGLISLGADEAGPRDVWCLDGPVDLHGSDDALAACIRIRQA